MNGLDWWYAAPILLFLALGAVVLFLFDEK